MADRSDRGLRIVLLGAPGCGKGTQAGLLTEELGIPMISTGDMLRDAVGEGSDLGRRVESIMASGALVDDETMAEVVGRRLGQKDARRGFLLDGYPRTLGQAATLEGILSDQGEALDAVVLIEVPEEELIERALGRQRADDRTEVIRHRLQVYREKTEPLVGYYERLGLLRRVDGHQSIEQVQREVRAAVAVSV